MLFLLPYFYPLDSCVRNSECTHITLTYFSELSYHVACALRKGGRQWHVMNGPQAQPNAHEHTCIITYLRATHVAITIKRTSQQGNHHTTIKSLVISRKNSRNTLLLFVNNSPSSSLIEVPCHLILSKLRERPKHTPTHVPPCTEKAN